METSPISDKRPDETNNVPEPPSIGDLPTMGESPDGKRQSEEPLSIGDWPTLGEMMAPKREAAELPSIGSLPTEGEWAIRDDQRFHSRRWQPGEEILGRYVVEKELGQGGMGVVYGCFDKVGGVRVAVKALPPELSHNSVEMEEVRENFQLVYKLSHPNIAGVRTLEKDARGEYFLVMEIAEGESLRKWIRRNGKRAG